MKTRHITPTAVNGIEAQAFDLSVGDTVELRNGLHMLIDTLEGEVNAYPIRGYREGEVVEQFTNWTATGSYYENEISFYDIVALHRKAPTLYTKLSVGTKVRLRNGQKVTIVSTTGNNPNYPIIGQYVDAEDRQEEWTSAGEFFLDSTNEFDIVSVVEEQKPQYHKYGLIELVELLVEGKVFYTREGVEVKLSDRQFSFGKDKLDLNKLVNTPLSLVRPVPFEIDPVKGRHCFVWDDDKKQGKYAVVIYISDDVDYPYVTTGSVNYKNAEPAYP